MSFRSLISPDAEIVRIVANEARRLGVITHLGAVHGASDVRHMINLAGVPSVIYGCGAVGPDGKSVMHSPNERMWIESLIDEAKVFGLIMLASCQPAGRSD